VKGHRAKPSGGFTLLEVVVALAVLAVVLVSVFRMQVQDLGVAEALAFHARATLLARSKLAAIETADPARLEAGAGDFGEEFPGYRWRIDINDCQDELLGPTAERLKIIDLHIDLDQERYGLDLRTVRLLKP